MPRTTQQLQQQQQHQQNESRNTNCVLLLNKRFYCAFCAYRVCVFMLRLLRCQKFVDIRHYYSSLKEEKKSWYILMTWKLKQTHNTRGMCCSRNKAGEWEKSDDHAYCSCETKDDQHLIRLCSKIFIIFFFCFDSFRQCKLPKIVIAHKTWPIRKNSTARWRILSFSYVNTEWFAHQMYNIQQTWS